MDKQKEIKFQDKTLNGYKYCIYSTEGKNPNYPIVGAVYENNRWHLWEWTIDGHSTASKIKHACDLVPVEPAELEGLEVGDSVYSVTKNKKTKEFKIIAKDDFNVWLKAQDIKISTHYDGISYCIGNGQKLFYSSEARALASIKQVNKST